MRKDTVKTVSVPGWGTIDLKHVVIDLNGTVTESGRIIPGVLDGLKALRSEGFDIYVLSGDTRNNLHRSFDGSPGINSVVTNTARDKKAFVESIGPGNTVCIGNGNIDAEMFRVARLAICTIQAEGAASKALMEADIVVTHIKDAFDVLLDTDRLIATLRS